MFWENSPQAKIRVLSTTELFEQSLIWPSIILCKGSTYLNSSPTLRRKMQFTIFLQQWYGTSFHCPRPKLQQSSVHASLILVSKQNHFGSGAGSGHYTAFSLRDADAVVASAPATAASATVSDATASATSSEESAWWRLDDSRVERLPDPPSAHAANARSAYLLFYRRRGLTVPDFGAAPSAANVASIIAAMQASVEAAAIEAAVLGDDAAAAGADPASDSASASVASAVIDLD
jgi:hypothetical protein